MYLLLYFDSQINNDGYFQLKTVLERCEKKNFDSIQYLHNMDHRKSTNGNDFNSPSPPERDQQKRDVPKMMYKTYSKESITPLTQADLEEYTKKFDETTLIQHQKQSSYAQSEGYHSYVSSSDSSSTPFIDRYETLFSYYYDNTIFSDIIIIIFYNFIV